jgi:hypothetical protein
MEADRHELWKTAFVAATLYNAQPQYGKRKRKAVKPEDLIPSLKPARGGKSESKAQTPDEMLFIARMIHARYQAGRRVKTKPGPAVKRPPGPVTRRK